MAGQDDFDVDDMLEGTATKKPFTEENGSEVDSRKDDKKRHKHKRSKQSRSRSRSRSPKRRHRRRSGSRERRRSGSRERRRRRSRSPRRRSRSPRRRSRSPRRDKPFATRERKVAKSPSPPRPIAGAPQIKPFGRSPEPDIPSEDKDRRTVMCMQLAAKVGPKHLEEFFQKVGQVAAVKMIADKNSRRSKGIAYVEFHDESSVIEAMKLTGQRVYGVPIIVQPTMAEKNRLAAQAQNLMKQEGPRKILVGSLLDTINDAMMRKIFEPFGIVERVLVQKDDAGKSKGFGFVEFKESDSAERALKNMNGFDILGQKISVTLVNDNPHVGQMPGASGAMEVLDGDEFAGGVGMTQQSRVNLMAKLARTHDVGMPAPKPALSMSTASTCFMLSNMFDPNSETEPGWESDIRDDVLEECNVYGPVLHIHVDAFSQGNVYIKCVTPQIAANAFNALNGRFFSGKQIVAQYIPEDTYHSKFPIATTASQPLKPLSDPA